MFSTFAAFQGTKSTGKFIGTHQKLDKIARKSLGRFLPKNTYFPEEKEIIHFEGIRGPDGIKRKSPGVDEPMHFILRDKDDGKLIGMILDHQYNLKKALIDGDHTRAAFEAAWMAHAITDGLTPAHHFPLEQMADQLMTEKEFIKVFGTPIKGIMRGRNLLETARHNWLYWGANGYMSKHVAFEYGVLITTAALPDRHFTPKFIKKDLENVDIKQVFYESLDKINRLDMYSRFSRDGWTTDLAIESKSILLPEIVRAITLCWASAIPELSTKAKKN